MHTKVMNIVLKTSEGELSVQAGPLTPLSRLIWFESGLAARPLCSGIGTCGRCKVRIVQGTPEILPADIKCISTEELEQGYRLACRHFATEGMVVEVSDSAISQPKVKISPDLAHRGNALRPAGLAVDLGTTSVVWQVLALQKEGIGQSEELLSGQMLNPQMGAGADIMARLAVASTPEGAALMQQKIVQLLLDLVDQATELGIKIENICLAGNPAMTSLTLGKAVDGLSSAPYRLDYKGGAWADLPGLPPLWVPPQFGPFVGGDISAALPVLRFTPRPYLLADMGTNGEFLLVQDASADDHRQTAAFSGQAANIGPYSNFGLRQAMPLKSGMPLHPSMMAQAPPAPPVSALRIWATSVPLGPALEGVGMSCGNVAGPGSITAFRLTPAGLAAETWDNAPPTSICGVGYLSLLHILRTTGLLKTNGQFVSPGTQTKPSPEASTLSPLAFRLAASLVRVQGEWRLPLPGNLYLSAQDVENVLKVKAAFSLAVEHLLRHAGIAPSRVESVCLAGALGQHVSLAALDSLGFLRQGLAKRTRSLGNAALAGAAILLQSEEERQKICHQEVEVLDLASDPSFQTEYLNHMMFS